MFDAADILVDGQPAADHLGIERLVRRRRREAQKIPARIDESVEGVGLAHRFAAARWALSMLPRRMATQRIRSEEHTSELQSLLPISYAVFCSKKKTQYIIIPQHST